MDELIAAYSQNDLSISATLVNLLVGLLLGLVLKAHFERFSSVLSGKRELARILPFLVLIVCLIISIVKSSLALSLGLVGALSIVRFRTPIKEPEELVYLFMAIAMGLGLGANQIGVTVLSSFAILFAVSVIRWKFYSLDANVLYLLVELPDGNENSLISKQVTKLISDHVDRCDLKRLDSRDGVIRISYMIDTADYEVAFDLTEDLRQKFSGAAVTLIDQSRIPGV